MAGIAGTLDLVAGLAPAAPLVRRMLGTLVHRGPDGEVVLEDRPVAFGVRVLAVLDGPEPTFARGRLRLVLDGDIVNCREVAASLRARGRPADGASQTATVLAAWAEWGPACLDLLEGGFAFAIWDADGRRLYCARDRIGLKPLYYTVAGGRFRFASEIKALVTDGSVPRVPDERRVLQYLAYGIADHTDETMLRGILQVPAAGLAVVSQSGVESVTRWYRLHPAPADGPVGERVRNLLEDAVALRLRGRGTVGATLSGGLDSASVLGTAARLRLRAGEEPPVAVVARTSDPRLDEWPYAELLLDRYGIRSVQVRPDEQALVEDFDAFAWSLDEPCHSPSVYGHWRVMQAARAAGVDVILEGQSGERFGGLGYWYPQLLYDMLRRGRLDAALREIDGRRRVQGVGVSRSLLDLGKLCLPRTLRAAHASAPGWIRSEVEVEPPPLPARGLFNQQVHEMTVVDLPLLCREVDRDAAAFSLAERSPFQDSRIVEYALSLPAEALHRRGWGKAPLLDAMRGIVPDEILDRPTKQGFTVDQAHWVRGAFGAAVERTFRSHVTAERPYWDATAVLRLLDECRAGRAPATDIWRAYSVERWLELVVDPAQPAVPAAA